MRFRSKFGLQGWLIAGLFLIFSLPWVFGSRMSILDQIAAVSTGASLILLLLSRYFVYWEIDETVIRERRFGKEKAVPYPEISQIVGRTYWNRRPTQIMITYFRASDPPKERRLYASPADVEGFLNALKKVAPSAAIYVRT